MKKRIALLLILISSITIAWAQSTTFGVNAGLYNVTATAKLEAQDAPRSSESDAGFYLGILADISLSDKVHVQPAVNYANTSGDGWVQLPIMFKYYAAPKFYLQAGPQGTFSLEDGGGIVNTFGLDLGFGLGFDIDKHFFIEARYALELTDRTPDAIAASSFGFDPSLGSFDIRTKLNTLQFGLGYRF
ncbi:outer membrane beta-barrel protein [Sungkyunkwania multivorans]|uniref:Outer membrane beta-barrel protein n=1 Tax=Sungkyunkwania multivorans TaxID=1173618 RepID=A0ABW3CY77_9FLAO